MTNMCQKIPKEVNKFNHVLNYYQGGCGGGVVSGGHRTKTPISGHDCGLTLGIISLKPYMIWTRMFHHEIDN